MHKALLCLASILSLPACGGRAGLSDVSGRAYQRMWNAQVESQPAKGPSTLSARDAKIALGRHYGKDKSGSITTGGSFMGGYGAGRGGQLTPSTTDLGSGNPEGREVRLK